MTSSHHRRALALLALLGCDASTVSDTGAAIPDVGADVAADAPPDAPLPDYCVPATGDPLEDVTTTPASPYFVHHPAAPGTPRHTVLFFPGGDGARDLADLSWQWWLADPSGADDMRVIVPYSLIGNFPGEAERGVAILDEVLACYGGDPDHVHLAGSSLGGLAAFDRMLIDRARFRTLLGAPGLFNSGTLDTQVEALTGRAVFLGVGALDTDPWASGVPALHDALSARGIDSELVTFPGEGHILSEAFDPAPFYTFWRAH